MRTFAILLFLATCLTGCATFDLVDNISKTEPTTHVLNSVDKIKIDDDLQCLVQVKHISRSGDIMPTQTKGKKQWLYYSVDISKALGQSNLGLPADGIEKNDINLVDRRDRIVKLMLTVANQNSETYLNRFFSSDLTLRGVQKITNRSLTVFQTATTTASPEIPAIIGISNLVVDGIMEDYQSLTLADKTFQAMAKLIRVERDELDQEIRQKLLDNTSYSQYTLQDAIKDIAILS